MPRFQPEAFTANLGPLPPCLARAVDLACLPVLLALAWVLARGEAVFAIPDACTATQLKDNPAPTACG